jgi:hypothetical protein
MENSASHWLIRHQRCNQELPSTCSEKGEYISGFECRAVASFWDVTRGSWWDLRGVLSFECLLSDLLAADEGNSCVAVSLGLQCGGNSSYPIQVA